jgi:hypothetical protein
LTAPLVLNHKENDYSYVDTEIKLGEKVWGGDEDDLEFTLVLDYQFIDTRVGAGDDPKREKGTEIAKQYLLDCSQA